MGTPFDGDRQRRRSHDLPLTEYPEWGLDILRGLYGPETIARAVDESAVDDPPKGTSARRPDDAAARRAHPSHGPWAARLADYDWADHRTTERPVNASTTPTAGGAADAPPTHGDKPAEQVSPFVSQLDAVTQLVQYVERRFKHRH